MTTQTRAKKLTATEVIADIRHGKTWINVQ